MGHGPTDLDPITNEQKSELGIGKTRSTPPRHDVRSRDNA